jgi:hypothetical protein
MKWVTDKEGLFEATQNMISQRIDKKSEDVIKKMNLNLDSLITSILE